MRSGDEGVVNRRASSALTGSPHVITTQRLAAASFQLADAMHTSKRVGVMAACVQ